VKIGLIWLEDGMRKWEGILSRALRVRGATDASIWDYAKTHSFVIVSKDNDFRQRTFIYGAPPKVIWLSIGNAGTWFIAELLRSRVPRIQSFIHDSNDTMLVLRSERSRT